MDIYVDVEKRFEDFKLKIKFDSSKNHIGILGESGSGKSMILKVISGIIKPDKGKIVVNGKIFFDSEKNINLKTRDRNIGYLFQDYALFPNMTVEENIASGIKGKNKRERVDEMISKFSLDGFGKRYPSALSGGQKQRVALARIMAYEPDIILLDEPFSALDSFLRDKLLNRLIVELEEYKGFSIMVSHDRDEIYRFSEDLIVIDKGEVKTYGNTIDIFERPKNKVAAKLTGCKNFSRAIKRDSKNLYLKDWDINLRLNREIPEFINYIGYRAHDFIDVRNVI